MENSFGETIRKLREGNNLLLREVSAKLEIDASVLSKIENNNRIAKKELIKKFAKIYNVDYNKLLIIWLSDKIVNELKDENNIDEILKIAGQKIKYGKE
ncbi:helix-turn-helix domain-containing protein [Galbibacter pacificus]|uniref:Helix-turn-helix transcriptional regulator n=1 Tax=Galbibacter pacificus TaxID=2996052 RepID=A0ABT6FNJ0_9FLAO|nr:helix-turn-helix transcriptional regulator [Galbibacter pacificus]MDG3581357.1 helix-turn-helix transcriptional regulator [Galbibacter pacificus]MDG3584835.1 helix-turn-helix transcriptional regulator [Galbibacter pacificus]